MTNNTATEQKLNHLGNPFKPAVQSPVKRLYNRLFARGQWRKSFGAKVIWHRSRQPGSDCSFRIFTSRCAA